MQKNIAFPSVSLQLFVEGEIKELLYSIKFLHTLFLENEEKTNETKNR